MKPDLSSPFLKYQLSEDEELTCHVLSDLNLAGIQNLLADTASDLLNIPLHVSDSSEEGRNKRAYTQGMLDAYRHLLNTHWKTLETIKEIEALQQHSQEGN